jgi:hypothetical protein
MPDGSIKPFDIAIYSRPFSFFAMTMMAIIFFSPLVFKYEEGGIAITSYDLLLEFARFYSYEGLN